MSAVHVVLGGSGAAGGAVVRALLAQHKEVRAVSRHAPTQPPSGVDWRVADVADPASLRTALDGAGVIYHCAQPDYTRWAALFPAMNTSVLKAAETLGARLVFADNLYTYDASAGPINEQTAERPRSRKGRVRLDLATQLLDWHRAGRVEVAIGRASDYFGPGVSGSVAGADFFRRVVAGKPAHWTGRADQPHALTYTDDFARALAHLGETPSASGRAWVVPTAEALTPRAFASLVAQEAGRSDRGLSVLPTWAMPLLGLFVPIMRELYDVRYQTQRPFVVDGHAFSQRFGFTPTPHREAIRATLASLQASQRSS